MRVRSTQLNYQICIEPRVTQRWRYVGRPIRIRGVNVIAYTHMANDDATQM